MKHEIEITRTITLTRYVEVNSGKKDEAIEKVQKMIEEADANLFIGIDLEVIEPWEVVEDNTEIG